MNGFKEYSLPYLEQNTLSYHEAKTIEVDVLCLKSVQGVEWLNDTAIDGNSAMLIPQLPDTTMILQTRCWSIFDNDELVHGTHQETVAEFFRLHRRLHGRAHIYMIINPLNSWGIRNHWVVLHIDITAHSINVYNSLGRASSDWMHFIKLKKLLNTALDFGDDQPWIINGNSLLLLRHLLHDMIDDIV